MRNDICLKKNDGMMERDTEKWTGLFICIQLHWGFGYKIQKGLIWVEGKEPL